MKNTATVYPALIENNFAIECFEQSIETLVSQYDIEQVNYIIFEVCQKAKREIAILMNCYGLIYEKFNENSKALVCAQESFAIIMKCEQNQEQKIDQQIICNNIGQLHFKLFHFSEAIDFLTESVDLKKNLEGEKDLKGLGFQIQLLSLSYLQVGNIEKSQELRNLSRFYSSQINEIQK